MDDILDEAARIIRNGYGNAPQGAQVLVLIDIARTLRGIETWCNERGVRS